MKRFSLIFVLLLFAIPSFVEARQEVEKKPLRIYLNYYRQNDLPPSLKISTKSKNGKRFEPVEGMLVNLFIGEETSEGFIGRVKTNMWGNATLHLPIKYLDQINKANTLNFIASVTGDANFKDASEEIEITKAKIELTLKEEDSVKMMYAKVLVMGDSGWTASPETEVRLVIKRSASDIPASEEDSYETNEEGDILAEFNKTINGDVKGNILVGAKIVDNETLGNIEATKSMAWGVPIKRDDSFSERTLWATRDKTPWWLLIFPNLIITCVWGFIYYLIYLVFKIRKMGKLHESA